MHPDKVYTLLFSHKNKGDCYHIECFVSLSLSLSLCVSFSVCVYVLVYVNSVIYYEHGDDGQFNRLHRENFSFTSLKKSLPHLRH